MNQNILLRRVGLVCALFFASPTVHGQDIDWPQFRGPNSNPVGAHTRLAERWSKTGNVEWSQEIPGRGWSSPIVTDGKLFCLSEEGQTFVIATGERFQLLRVNELDDMAQASPALVGERLLIRTERRLYSIRSGR